jgi:hypothetical protein
MHAIGESAQVDRDRTGAKIRFRAHSCQTGMGDLKPDRIRRPGPGFAEKSERSP